MSRPSDLNDLVLPFLDKLFVPAITNLKLDWGSAATDYAPFRPPPLLLGEVFRASAFIVDEATDTDLILTGLTSKVVD